MTEPLVGVIEKLLETNRLLTERILELALAPAPVQVVKELPRASQPMFDSEEVEDAKFQLQHGLIDEQELSAVLKDAGYANATIEHE